MSDFDRDLEHELRAGAPQARPLFVDDVARRLHAQSPGLRPNRLRLSLALAFSALTVVALGVLGAPAYVAHAADALVQTASTTFSGGSGPSTNVLSGGAASSGSFQYETPEPICHRTNTDPVNRTYVLIVDSPSNHFGHPDIIPAPPWGCPPSHSPGRPGDPSETTTTLKATNDGPGTLAGQKKFNLAVTAADGSTPQGFILCFDNLSPFDQTVLIDGKATCTYGMRAVGTHNITAVFHTGDVRKWASSAGNVLTITVGKASSSVSVQTSRTPAPSGAVVVFTATVTGASGFSTPTGSVQFSDGSTALGSPVALSTAGVAQLSSSSLAIGTHTIKATYGGDALYDAQSATVSQAIATAPVPPRPAVLPSPPPSLEPPAHADVEPSAATSRDQTQQPAPSTAQAPPSLRLVAKPATAGALAVAPKSGVAAPTWVLWPAATFGTAATVTASIGAPQRAAGIQFVSGSAVIELDAVTDGGQAITTLGDALDIAIPNVPAGVAPMYQRGAGPWVLIPRLGGTTLAAGQPDGWYLDGTTLHILTRHLSRFALATALDVKWGTRRRVHLQWARRIVMYGAPNIEGKATYTLRRGKKVYGTWTRMLPAGKGAPANLWLGGKNVVPGNYRLTIAIQAGPQRWTQVVAIRYLR